MSFFGDSRSSPPPSQLLPKATDTDGGDDDTWWRDGAANRREQVMRHVFLAASIICGVSGVALLVVFTLVYFFRYRNQNQNPSNLPCYWFKVDTIRFLYTWIVSIILYICRAFCFISTTFMTCCDRNLDNCYTHTLHWPTYCLIIAV